MVHLGLFRPIDVRFSHLRLLVFYYIFFWNDVVALVLDTAETNKMIPCLNITLGRTFLERCPYVVSVAPRQND